MIARTRSRFDSALAELATPKREAAKSAVRDANPWVPMPKNVRRILSGALILYTLVCVVGALVNSSQNSAGPYLAFSTFVYLIALAFPFFRYDEERDGWFHPLVFATLWTMFKTLPRRTPFLIFGLDQHAVLALPQEELTRLVGHENLLSALALVATYAGFYLVKRPRLPRLRLNEPRRIGVVIAAIAIAGLTALAIFVKLSGSLTQHFLNLSLNSTAKVFTQDVTAVGHLSTVVQWLAFCLAIVLGYRARLIKNPFFVALCLMALAMVYFATGKRSLIFNPLAMGAITWMITARRVPVFSIAVLGTSVFALFTFLLLVRGAASQSKNLTDLQSIMQQNASGSVSSGFEELTYRLGSYSSAYPIFHHVPDDSSLLWGESYLLILGRPIPRALWPTKPRGTDFRAGVVFFNSPWGIPPGPVAEAFWNFHIPGVAMVFFLFGIFTRWISNLYLRYREHGVATFFYAYTLVVFSPTENSVTGWMQGVIPIAIFAIGTGIIGPRRAGSKKANSWQAFPESNSASLVR